MRKYKTIRLGLVITISIILAMFAACLTVYAEQQNSVDSISYTIYSEKCPCEISSGGGSYYGSPDCGLAWTGKEICPKIRLKSGNDYLKENEDYVLSYSKNIEIGTGQITVTYIGDYIGTKTYEFPIRAVLLEDEGERFTFTLSEDHFIADGTRKDPDISIFDNWRGRVLQQGTDYTIKYVDDINAGTGKVYIYGIGNYISYTVIPYTIEGISIGDADIALKNTIYTYDGSAKTPTVSATYKGETLKRGEDYELKYESNEDDGTAYVYVIGKGIFTDAVKMSFVILPYNSGMDSVYEDGTFISTNCVYGITDEDNHEVELCCPASNDFTKLVIPATISCEGEMYEVTSIGHKAFYKNKKIKALEAGNNVKSIENYAFYGCINLSDVKFGSKLDIIGSSSFRKCTKLTSISLPKSLDELGKNSFYGCTKLKKIVINASSVLDVNVGAIKNISTKTVIKVPKKHLKKYKKVFNSKTGFKKTMKIRSLK